MSRLGDYAAAIEDVVTLTRTGRVGMALTVLEGLTVLVDDALLQAMAEAREEGRRSLAAEITGENCRPAKRRALRPHEWLRERVRHPELRRVVLDILRFDDAALDHVLAGKAQLSSAQWRRLRREMGEAG
jgi:hypothetical protein